MGAEVKLRLPFPPSVNNLYINVNGKGRVPTVRYRKWKKAAIDSMWGQPLQYFKGPVSIDITYEDAGRSDLDNLQKAVIDHLVNCQIILGDDRKVVRKITLQWGDVKGAVVEVLAF